MVEMSQANIVRAAGINASSISAALYDLERDGRIMLARPGNPRLCAAYQVLKQPERSLVDAKR